MAGAQDKASMEQPSPDSSTPDLHVIHVPSYSSWFSWDKIDECEIRSVPEFFSSEKETEKENVNENEYGRNPKSYKYLRNSIIKRFRRNPSRKLTFTEVRRTLIGDVGSIRRVFEFVENWGLINYSKMTHSNKPTPILKQDNNNDSCSSSSSLSYAKPDTNNNSNNNNPNSSSSNRICSGCKSLCTIACFACDKYDMTLCARCYVRGTYPLGVTSSQFKRVEITQSTKPDWTDKDILHLLEALMHFGDDWKKVSQHVSAGKTDKECIAHFLKLPFGEEFLPYTEYDDNQSNSPTKKRMRLTPLADASNPIMAQAAFLSALAGVQVAEAAAQAAVSALSEVDSRTTKGNLGSQSRLTMSPEVDGSSDGNAIVKPLEESYVDANSQLEKEQVDVEGAISEIIRVQMKEIQDRIAHFEELDLQMEKEWQQLEQMKSSLFVDQLALLFHRNAAPGTETSREQ